MCGNDKIQFPDAAGIKIAHDCAAVFRLASVNQYVGIAAVDIDGISLPDVDEMYGKLRIFIYSTPLLLLSAI